MSGFDYKKAQRELYLPGRMPAVVDVPEMTFIMVDGQGDPNTGAAYRRALETLYGLSYTIRMSRLSGNAPDGYFEYVVPPLEGLWTTLDGAPPELPIRDKEALRWTAMIRQPAFVTPEVFDWACAELLKKRPEADAGSARLKRWTEGLCCQIMHMGSYDEEAGSLSRMEAHLESAGFRTDFSDERRHHEIYLSDPRRCAPERLRTVLRLPIRRMDGTVN